MSGGFPKSEAKKPNGPLMVGCSIGYKSHPQISSKTHQFVMAFMPLIWIQLDTFILHLEFGTHYMIGERRGRWRLFVPRFSVSEF